jgi:hypothetical protein
MKQLLLLASVVAAVFIAVPVATLDAAPPARPSLLDMG